MSQDYGDTMDWTLFALIAISGLAAGYFWLKFLKSRQIKAQKRRTNLRDEEFVIDPANVPEFRSTWRDAR